MAKLWTFTLLFILLSSANSWAQDVGPFCVDVYGVPTAEGEARNQAYRSRNNCVRWRDAGPLLQEYPAQRVFLPNPRYQNTTRDNPIPTRSRAENLTNRNTLNAAFQQLKAVAIARITSQSTSPAQQAALISRVENIILTYSASERGSCDNRSDYVNGLFSGNADVINLCPIIGNMPVEASLDLLAHELAHALDPCYSSHRYEGTQTLRLLSSAQLDQRVRTCLSDDGQLNQALYNTTRTGQNGEVSRLERLRETRGSDQASVRNQHLRRDAYNRLVDCGLLVRTRQAVETFDGHPFRAVAHCLSQNYGRTIGIKERSDPAFQQPNYTNGTTINDNHCPLLVQENFADYVGASLLNDYYAIPENVSRLHTAAASESSPDAALFFLNYTACSYDGNDPDHALPNDRVATFASYPNIANHLNCRPPEQIPGCVSETNKTYGAVPDTDVPSVNLQPIDRVR